MHPSNTTVKCIKRCIPPIQQSNVLWDASLQYNSQKYIERCIPPIQQLNVLWDASLQYNSQMYWEMHPSSTTVKSSERCIPPIQQPNVLWDASLQYNSQIYWEMNFSKYLSCGINCSWYLTSTFSSIIFLRTASSSAFISSCREMEF